MLGPLLCYCCWEYDHARCGSETKVLEEAFMIIITVCGDKISGRLLRDVDLNKYFKESLGLILCSSVLLSS